MTHNTPQEEFDRTYITSSEICHELDVSRPAILDARRRGLLPEPILVNGNQLTLWKRDEVRPYIEAWKATLDTRRAAIND